MPYACTMAIPANGGVLEFKIRKAVSEYIKLRNFRYFGSMVKISKYSKSVQIHGLVAFLDNSVRAILMSGFTRLDY